jgi:hypothetical protein
MGIFAIEIFLLDFLFKRRHRLTKSLWDYRGVIKAAESNPSFTSVEGNTKT